MPPPSPVKIGNEETKGQAKTRMNTFGIASSRLLLLLLLVVLTTRCDQGGEEVHEACLCSTHKADGLLP